MSVQIADSLLRLSLALAKNPGNPGAKEDAQPDSIVRASLLSEHLLEVQKLVKMEQELDDGDS